MQDGENTTNNNEFQIKSFLDENSNLLTIMGVFGALSVYLNQVEESISFIRQLGIMASLLLFLLISLTILYNALKTSDGDVDILQLLSMKYRNIIRMVFIISFGILCMAISYSIVSTIVGQILVGFILMFVAPIVFAGFVDKIIEKSNVSNKILGFVICSIFILIISTLSYPYTIEHQIIPLTLLVISLIITSTILMLIAFVQWIIQLPKDLNGLVKNIFNCVKCNIKSR